MHDINLAHSVQNAATAELMRRMALVYNRERSRNHDGMRRTAALRSAALFWLLRIYSGGTCMFAWFVNSGKCNGKCKRRMYVTHFCLIFLSGGSSLMRENISGKCWMALFWLMKMPRVHLKIILLCIIQSLEKRNPPWFLNLGSRYVKCLLLRVYTFLETIK